MSNYNEQFSVLFVIAGCVMIGVATHNALLALGIWLCVFGVMICLKAWFKRGVE